MAFLEAVLTGPLWFNAVLLAGLIVVYLAYGLRSVTAPSAWGALLLFFVWVAASNSWRLIPQPDPAKIATVPQLEEAWRLWAVWIREGLIIAYLAAGAVTLGFMSWLVWGAHRRSIRITALTAFYVFVTFAAQTGEVMQRYICSTNSPDLGMEHLYWAAGQRTEACARLFVKLLAWTGELAVPLGSFLGPTFFPLLTASPLLIILWRARQRLRAKRQ